MGKRGRRSDRRRQQRETALPAVVTAPEPEIAHAPPVLRLVRPEAAGVHGEPVSAGLAGPPVDPVRDVPGSDGNVAAPPLGHHVVSAARSEPDESWLTADLISRSFDAAEINPIINHPSVFKYVGCFGVEPGSLDLAPILSDQRNVLLMADGGGILFIFIETGVYEVHTTFLKPDRERQSQHGPHIRNVCLAAYHWMFTHTDCVILQTKIPHHNRAALIFSPLVGWVPEFDRKAIWHTVGGDMVDMTFATIRYDDWVRKTPALIKVGRAFHDKLEQEFTRLGRSEPQHPDEDCHDLHVGACAQMIRAGQLEKAIWLYNRWARFAGYGEMSLIAKNPAVIDIGNALLQIVGDTFKVILVR